MCVNSWLHNNVKIIMYSGGIFAKFTKICTLKGSFIDADVEGRNFDTL